MCKNKTDRKKNSLAYVKNSICHYLPIMIEYWCDLNDNKPTNDIIYESEVHETKSCNDGEVTLDGMFSYFVTG